jgi:hypothetical protein
VPKATSKKAPRAVKVSGAATKVSGRADVN